jgi:hemolysin III
MHLTTLVAPSSTLPSRVKAGRDAHEEHANSLTHALGALLSVVGALQLLPQALQRGEWLITLGTFIFCGALLVLYSASALYHGLRNRRWKHWFLRFDYAGIFLLIGGTYTPILLVHLRNTLGWGVLAAVWTLCGIGMVLAVRHQFPWRSRIASTLFYLGLGWLCLAVLPSLATAMPPESFRVLVIGGLCYTAGTVFFAWDELPYYHAVWHVFVLAGSGCHWFAIYWSLASA